MSWHAEGHIGHEEEEKINSALVGRKIVKVSEEQHRTYEWEDTINTGMLHLDDGTKLRVIPNEGCGGCSAGWYELKALNECDNVITRAEVQEKKIDPDDDWDEERIYTLFVYAEDRRLPVAVVEGDDGNGYYGTGFELQVIEA